VGGAPAASGGGRRGCQFRRCGPPAVAIGGRRAAVELEEALRFLGARWKLRRRGCARGELPGGHGGRRRRLCAGGTTNWHDCGRRAAALWPGRSLAFATKEPSPLLRRSGAARGLRGPRVEAPPRETARG
jgi:hypothetical protein